MGDAQTPRTDNTDINDAEVKIYNQPPNTEQSLGYSYDADAKPLDYAKLMECIESARSKNYTVLDSAGHKMNTHANNEDKTQMTNPEASEFAAAATIKGVFEAAQKHPSLRPEPRIIVRAYIHTLTNLHNFRANTSPVKIREPQEVKSQIPGINALVMFMINLQYIGKIVSIDSKADSSGPLSIYQPDGENAGLYLPDQRIMRNLVRSYSPATVGTQLDVVMKAVSDAAPRIRLCTDPDMVPVKNGVFDYKAKRLVAFNPGLVFTSKTNVDYNPYAYNVTIHNDKDGTDWNVEDWLDEFYEDPRMVNLLWQIIGGAIRYNVPWHRGILFYSETGNNGKGTICQLIRNIIGPTRSASIQMSDISKQYALECLPRVQAIITDENDVGDYVDRAGAIKALITGDEIVISAKYEANMPYAWRGLMIQCVNEMPKVRDRSESYYRRFIMMPFTHCFTGRERSYIKNDYIGRDDVMQYVLWRVLNMADYYEFDEPKATRTALDEYKEYNDPIRAFVSEIVPRLRWNRVPFAFLYDLYVAWMNRNVPGGTPIAKQRFITELIMQLNNFGLYTCSDRSKPIRKDANDANASEPLIAEYNLKDWMRKRSTGTARLTPEEMCMPCDKMGPAFRGIEYIGGPRRWDYTARLWDYDNAADDPALRMSLEDYAAGDDAELAEKKMKLINKALETSAEIIKNHYPASIADYVSNNKPYIVHIIREVEQFDPMPAITRGNPAMSLQAMADAARGAMADVIDICPENVDRIATDTYLPCQDGTFIVGDVATMHASCKADLPWNTDENWSAAMAETRGKKMIEAEKKAKDAELAARIKAEDDAMFKDLLEAEKLAEEAAEAELNKIEQQEESKAEETVEAEESEKPVEEEMEITTNNICADNADAIFAQDTNATCDTDNADNADNTADTTTRKENDPAKRTEAMSVLTQLLSKRNDLTLGIDEYNTFMDKLKTMSDEELDAVINDPEGKTFDVADFVTKKD